MIVTFLNFNEARFEFRQSCYLKQFNLNELKVRLEMVSPHAIVSQNKQTQTLLNIYQEEIIR